MFKAPRPELKIYRHIIYAVPSFSNPSSGLMSLRRRQQLVQVAREHDALIVTDDVYDQLQWPTNDIATSSNKDSAANISNGQEQGHKVSQCAGFDPAKDSIRACLPRIVDIDRTWEDGTNRPSADGFGNAVSNGSFSKIVGPGCRTGWAEGTEKFAFGLSQV